MKSSFHVSCKRYAVNIWVGVRGKNWVNHYHRKDLTFEMICKWKWYFDYLGALYKVKHPKDDVEVMTANYDYVPPRIEAIKVLNNKIKAKKGKITEFTRKLNLALATWDELHLEPNSLFPKPIPKIQDDIYYKAFVLKLSKLQNELVEMMSELNKLENDGK